MTSAAASLAAAVAAAWDAAHPPENTDAYAVFDGRTGAHPGWTVERWGAAALVRRFGPSGAAPSEVAALVDVLQARLGEGAPIVLKELGTGDRERGRGRLVAGALPAPAPDDPMGDREGRLIVREAGLRFGADLLYGRNPGLFLDAAEARAALRASSAGKRVLNLFSYTAGFGLAAAAGGAERTVNVDAVPSAIERGRVNYALNGLRVDARDHVKKDVFEYLRRAKKARQRFDTIVLDPPPVPTQGRARGKGRKRGYLPGRDDEKLLAGANELLADRGRLVLGVALDGVVPHRVHA